ncbi:MAG: pyridoxal-phosphate dependent enzyme, partial [Clostridiales bacterium]|nr:pyridoxal-phosphate dependent enzyme [Clostridiales bacterium]
MSIKDANRINLPESEMPKQWYNILADMKERPDPYLNPATNQPAKPEDFFPIFAEELARQEFATEPFIDIPEEIAEIYRMYRPSPLIRARQLEKLLDTPAKIYFKYEGNNTSGSHKLNSAVPQVYYNKKQGIKNLTTETGAGQWGT